MKKLQLIIAIFCLSIFLENNLPAANFELVMNIESQLMKQNWKKAHEQRIKDESIVEWIPADQTLNDFTEMVSFTTFDLSKQKNRPKSARDFQEYLRKATISAYPGSKVKWNNIKQSLNDVTYEWQLLNKYKDVVPQHEITRMTLDGMKLNQVTYIKKVPEIDAKTREEWIHNLQG